MQYLVAAVASASMSLVLWIFLRRQKQTARIIHEAVPALSLRLSHSGGIVETLTLPAGPIRCGFSPDYDIDLSKYMKAGRSAGKAPVEELSFNLAEGRLAVTAHHKIMMNGVERTSGSIPVAGSVLFKTCRFTFLGPAELQQERRVFPGASASRKRAIAPATLGLMAGTLLILGLADLGNTGFSSEPAPRPAMAAGQGTQAVAPITSMPELVESGVASPPLMLPSPYPAPRMVNPGQPIPDEPIDVLFIHAHPDDESIDFGALMALCREAGLKTATVLLTDGEGGIYQQDYTGPRDDMRSIRVQEAVKAMEYLGTSLYIRLGLQNSPYNSLLEVKGIQEVLQLWDSDAVTARLAEIIQTLGPRVVVSPEGPSFAREHFEHEATGELTRLALQHVRLQGGHVPEAHLVSVDPRQKNAYTNLIAFPRQWVRETQRQALLSHATQADASYFGVQLIENHHEELYLIQYWDMAVDHSRFFGIVARLPEPAPRGEMSFLILEDKKEFNP